MTERPELVVIGGGIVGTAAAYFLSEAGVDVTVIERDRIAAGASGHGPGFFNAFGGDFVAGSHLALGLESIRLIKEHREELERRQEAPGWFNERPSLAPAFTDDGIASLRMLYESNSQQLESASAGAVWIDRDEVLEQEPLLSSDVLGAYIFPSVLQIDGWKLSRLYASAAEERRAQFIQGEVIGFEWQGNRVHRVKLADGKAISCETVVIAMGSWTPYASMWIGFPLPICNLKGQLHVLKLEGYSLKHHVIERIALMQYPDGLFLLAATPDPAPGGGLRPTEQYIRPLTDTGIISEDTDLLLKTGISRFPFLKDAEIVKDLAGGRPMSPDLLPIIGTTPTFENVYIASGHGRKGIHLSAGTGKLIADLVTKGETEMTVDPTSFSPTRFMPERL